MAFLGKDFIQGVFPPEWSRVDIQTLELYTIFVMFSMFSEQLSGKEVVCHCDNLPVVCSIISQTSRNNQVMWMVRVMVLKMMDLRFVCRAVHVPGVDNGIIDALFRRQVSGRFLREAGLREVASPVPRPFRCKSLNLPETFI